RRGPRGAGPLGDARGRLGGGSRGAWPAGGGDPAPPAAPARAGEWSCRRATARRDLTAAFERSTRAFLLEPASDRPRALGRVREKRERHEAVRVVDAAEGDSRVASHEQCGASAGRQPEAEPV